MIVTVAEAAAFIGSPADPANANFIRLVAATDVTVKRYCGRVFERNAAWIEYPTSYGSPVLYNGQVVCLREWPILALTEVRIDIGGKFAADTIITDLTRFSFAGTGDPSRETARGNELRFLDGWFPEGERMVKVTYDGGYWAIGAGTPAMPEDLRETTMRLIAAAFARGASEVMKSESIGAYSYTRFEQSMDPIARSVLMSYRRW